MMVITWKLIFQASFRYGEARLSRTAANNIEKRIAAARLE
jgi:hypothetical protein